MPGSGITVIVRGRAYPAGRVVRCPEPVDDSRYLSVLERGRCQGPLLEGRSGRPIAAGV